MTGSVAPPRRPSLEQPREAVQAPRLKARPESAGQTPGSALSSMTPMKKGATLLLPREHHDW